VVEAKLSVTVLFFTIIEVKRCIADLVYPDKAEKKNWEAEKTIYAGKNMKKHD
jgi:hypothetical protein